MHFLNGVGEAATEPEPELELELELELEPEPEPEPVEEGDLPVAEPDLTARVANRGNSNGEAAGNPPPEGLPPIPRSPVQAWAPPASLSGGASGGGSPRMSEADKAMVQMEHGLDCLAGWSPRSVSSPGSRPAPSSPGTSALVSSRREIYLSSLACCSQGT